MQIIMQTELAIVGAGPAGMAATEVAADHGVQVTVIDEQATAGGQFLRQPPTQFEVSDWLGGRAYRDGKNLLNRVSNKQGPRWIMQSTVAGILRTDVEDAGQKFTLVLDRSSRDEESGNDASEPRLLSADAVLIAPGCFDLPVIFPGWNLPGVMATGGIQAFIKSQQFVPGERFLFAGSHPLQLVVADQIVQAGGKVAGVLFAQSRKRALALLGNPSVMLRNVDKLGQTAAILRRLRQARVPVKFNQTVLRANGQDCLQSVTTVPIGADGSFLSGAARDIECDRLGTCFGFLTSSELARQAGVDCTWDASRGGWVARHDDGMLSSVPGIYVAGEITGVAGSDAASLEGQLAAFDCAAKLGKISLQQADELSALPRRQLRQRNRFARLLGRLAWPDVSLFDQLMSDSVTLCKCEELTVGDLLNLLRQNPDISTGSSAKLLSRVGMGLCQGRYCHFSLTRLMAGHLGVPESKVGGFTARFPAKPVAIDRLIK